MRGLFDPVSGTAAVCIPVIVSGLFGWVASASAVEFNNDIRPIFNKHCVACHGGVKQASDLTFIYRDQALAVIEPGSPDNSSLIERVTSADDDERMPPPEHGPPLSSNEIELLKAWIRTGAKWQSHWSFVVSEAKIAPKVKQQDWVRKPVDAFVLGRLEAEGLTPSRDAEPARWLRRVSLDLIGLPPTPEERDLFFQAVEEFGEGAFEREVERLLDSSRFGERWASIWLDAVRYADSKGLGQDGRRSIWKYRDWVIEALNRDMPFDEFTIAQLAGDLLDDPSLDDLVATACHRLTATNEEGGTDDEQFRLEAVVDRVNTTWQVWQGMTFGCVQCHSHPYDPIRHAEYYQFLSFFNNTADSDLNSDDPRAAVPFDHDTYDHAREFDKQIANLKRLDFKAGYALLSDHQRWNPVTEMVAATQANTGLSVETVDGVAQFHTVGTVSKNTTIELEFTIPDRSEHVTAIRFTGLPHNPKTAIANSEWGFVLSHVELLSVTDAVWASVEIAPQMFGTGIVETQEDFGSSGASPSHPDLLDDLAVRFTTDMKWSVKELLSEIALSSTYRQSSRATPSKLERDPGNRLLSRGPRTRLSAEAVWDTHGSNESEALHHGFLKKCKQVDQPMTALLRDLKQRGLMEDTLVVWSGEFGRTPMRENRGGVEMKFVGRDHNPNAFTLWMAGAGVKTGTTYGSTDAMGYLPAENPVHLRDLHATLMHLLGIDHRRLTFPFQGLNQKLTGVVPAEVVNGVLS